jgi:DNA relaxase NicK
MKILQSVVVKQVLTEKSKKELLLKFSAKISQLRKECEQLQFEQKKHVKNNKSQIVKVNEHIKNQVQLRDEKIKLLVFQIDQLNLLPIGSEMKDIEVQAIIELEVGDNWDEKWQGTQIIIKDGIVTEIR